MLKEIVYPDYTKEGIKPLFRDYPTRKNLRLFGADTETYRGLPHTVQIHDGRETALFYVSKENILENFWEWVKPRCRERGVNICYFHNFNFDLRVLFSLYHLDFYEQFNDILIRLSPNYVPMKEPPTPGTEAIEAKILFGKVNCARLYQGIYDVKDGEVVFVPTVKLDIYDSFSFTQTSLKKSLVMFGIEGNKLAQPEGLGRERLTGPEFEEYSKRDAEIEYLLGEKILEFHEEYKTRPAISLSQFSGRVFRRYFFDKGGTIQHPPDEIARAAELSYHAGKNGYYLDGPKIVEDVYEVDINSAFPYAMSRLPQMVKGKFIETKKFIPWRHGIYCISGEVRGGKYPLVYDHAFKPIEGKFEDVWTTSYELERILKSVNISVDGLWGYLWEPGEYARNSFSDFVNHFYEKKQSTPKADPHYNFYKIVLNALYGRFAASIEERKIDVKKDEDNTIIDELTGKIVLGDYRMDSVTGLLTKVSRTHRAGGMTNFLIASLITGATRAQLYDLETKYQALHSATDSIKTTILPEDVGGLGGHKVECFGRCYFFRNKLYLHFSKSFEYCNHEGRPDLVYDGEQHLCKAAYHGFKGPPSLLFAKRRELLETHHLKYEYTHVVGLREGMKRGETPCDFTKREEILCLCCGDKKGEPCKELKCHCQGRLSLGGAVSERTSTECFVPSRGRGNSTLPTR